MRSPAQGRAIAFESRRQRPKLLGRMLGLQLLSMSSKRKVCVAAWSQTFVGKRVRRNADVAGIRSIAKYQGLMAQKSSSMSAPNKAQFGTGSDQAGERARVIHARCDVSGVHSKSVLNLWGQVEDFGAKSLTLAAIASPQPGLQEKNKAFLVTEIGYIGLCFGCGFHRFLRQDSLRDCVEVVFLFAPALVPGLG